MGVTLRGRQLTPMQPLQASLETVGTSMGVTPSTRGMAIRVSPPAETVVHLHAPCNDGQNKASLLVSSWIPCASPPLHFKSGLLCSGSVDAKCLSAPQLLWDCFSCHYFLLWNTKSSSKQLFSPAEQFLPRRSALEQSLD